jgi:hypothetical protein
MSEQTNKGPLQAVFGLIAGAAVLWYFWGGGVHNQVASNFIDTYEIAKRNGDASQACVHAGIVAAAFLQAKDEQKYREWREVEKQDCELSRKKTSEEFEKRVWPNGKPEWLRK